MLVSVVPLTSTASVPVALVRTTATCTHWPVFTLLTDWMKALLPAPKLLFLDEPFEGIDAVASRQIKDLLLSFVSRGGTIFLTSHILEIVERLSTHIGVIAGGKMVAQGAIGELRAGAGSGKTLQELFIGLVGGDVRTHAELDWI